MPPGASIGGTKRGCGNCMRHKIYENSVGSVEVGMGKIGHERTNHVRRIMHILDVIRGVSRSSKCTKIVG